MKKVKKKQRKNINPKMILDSGFQLTSMHT